MNLRDRIKTQMAAENWNSAIREGCGTCKERRNYFEQFYVPGIAQRMSEIRPVFEMAQAKLEKLTHRIRVMDGNRYVGFMRKGPLPS